jgi:hypothetical protein
LTNGFSQYIFARLNITIMNTLKFNFVEEKIVIIKGLYMLATILKNQKATQTTIVFENLTTRTQRIYAKDAKDRYRHSTLM